MPQACIPEYWASASCIHQRVVGSAKSLGPFDRQRNPVAVDPETEHEPISIATPGRSTH